jgi:orotate phosphoribosyltransferase
MAHISKYAQSVARMLLKLKAVTLNVAEPYTWSSGLRSPIYCDNRLIISDVATRNKIKEYLAKVIREEFGMPELIAGVATAGIPQGMLVADMFHLPFVYVRPEPKGHGKGNQIEGKIIPRQKTVGVEDLISTGGSSLKVIEALRDADVTVLGMVSIFTYGFKNAEDAFENANVKLLSLCDYKTLIEIARVDNYIKEEDVILLQDWNKNPQAWSERFLNTQKHQS